VLTHSVHKSLNLNEYFTDSDGDPLSYRFYSNNINNSIPAVSGKMIFNCSYLDLSYQNAGTTTFTVVADDRHGGSKVVEFTAEALANQAPEAVGSFPDLILGQGVYLSIDPDVFSSIDPNGFFYDKEGDTLSYSLSSPNSSVVEVSGSLDIFTSFATGSLSLDFIANDEHGGTATQNIDTQVVSGTFDESTGEYIFSNLDSYFSDLPGSKTYSTVSFIHNGTSASAFLSNDGHDLHIDHDADQGTFIVTIEATGDNNETLKKIFAVGFNPV
jgi:hypothetical protein